MPRQPVLRCAVCGAEVTAETVWPWVCPNATATNRQHVLHRVPVVAPLRLHEHTNPLVRFDDHLVWARLAEAHGMAFDERVALIEQLDTTIASVDGLGFSETPFARSDGLSDALGFSARGGVWLKDHSVDVAGSAKARHLVSILLHLLSMERCGVTSERDRPTLAIASCGNAALAAATLAAAVRWPIDVFVPAVADRRIIERLRTLGATVTVCPRSAGDPPGDPCIHRFRDAVAAGAIPFSVQGPENALCLDAGRTIAWECTAVLGDQIDRFFAQAGGGALATSIGFGCADSGAHARLHAVQTQGCAPVARAWDLWRQNPTGVWGDYMWPWSPEPHSAASGILDDETYDWLGIVLSLQASNGSVVVVTEDHIADANRLVSAQTDIAADHTGTAALAGVLALRADIAADEVVVVPITGVQR